MKSGWIVSQPKRGATKTTTTKVGRRGTKGRGRANGRPCAEEEHVRLGRRRALAILETLGELVAASAFEVIGRPENDDFPIQGPASLASSLLPRKTSPDKLEDATKAVERGEALLNAGDPAGAVQELTRALELAPWQYKLAQKALLRRQQAYDALGADFASQRGSDFRQEWLWGRGVRWPGWYILSYIFFRKAFIAPENEIENSKPAGRESNGEKSKIPIEWVLVLVLAVLYNVCLFNYGLEY